jgi:chromate reductase, NAD(P)H dehydrogenase (quinone)
VLFEGIAGLPHFNPDDDAEGQQVPASVEAMRRAIRAADALLICTPEYAGAMPAVLKNLLEWTIGDASTYEKPIAWINASVRGPSGAADAHESLRKVLGYAHADVVEDACAHLPVVSKQVEADGTIADASIRAAIADVLGRLAAHVA